MYRLKVSGYASRPWMGNSIEPLVVGVGALIEQGVDTAKFEIRGLEGRRLRRASTKERVGYAQITTPKTESSPPSTLGDDDKRDALSIPSYCDGRQRVGLEFVLGGMPLIPSKASSIAASNTVLGDGGFDVNSVGIFRRYR